MRSAQCHSCGLGDRSMQCSPKLPAWSCCASVSAGDRSTLTMAVGLGALLSRARERLCHPSVVHRRVEVATTGERPQGGHTSRPPPAFARATHIWPCASCRCAPCPWGVWVQRPFNSRSCGGDKSCLAATRRPSVARSHLEWHVCRRVPSSNAALSAGPPEGATASAPHIFAICKRALRGVAVGSVQRGATRSVWLSSSPHLLEAHVETPMHTQLLRLSSAGVLSFRAPLLARFPLSAVFWHVEHNFRVPHGVASDPTASKSHRNGRGTA